MVSIFADREEYRLLNREDRKKLRRSYSSGGRNRKGVVAVSHQVDFKMKVGDDIELNDGYYSIVTVHDVYIDSDMSASILYLIEREG